MRGWVRAVVVVVVVVVVAVVVVAVAAAAAAAAAAVVPLLLLVLPLLPLNLMQSCGCFADSTVPGAWSRTSMVPAMQYRRMNKLVDLNYLTD